MDSELRWDLLPEEFPYEDKGCEIFPSCLNCPFPDCLEEEPWGKERFLKRRRAEGSCTWKLPHHTKAIMRALHGRLDIEKTVDWDRMPAAVAALSLGGLAYGKHWKRKTGAFLSLPGPLQCHPKRSGESAE
jgi:hypothetical protein